MALNTLILLLFISATVTASWLLPRSLQANAIVMMSALFLGWCSPLSLLILFLLVVVSYYLQQAGKLGTVGMITLVCTCWGMLFMFKTFRNAAFSDPAMQIVPLGLSYYTLKTMHYAIEGWKNTLPSHTFSQYLTYQFFLPTLMAGPINRFQEFHRSLCRRRWDSVLFSSGCERVLYGYVKVVCLSNYLVSTKLLPLIGTHTMEGTAPRAYLDCLAYGLNLYFQFSGYSDVAIGFALMLGLRVGENFNFPFLARSINEFWQRWHISLSLWCKDYVFMPVFSFGRSPLGAILFSMLGIALWHEFSLRYVAWGIYHALGIATWHLFQRIKPACLKESLDGFRGRVVTTGSVLLTLNFVILSFALTKEPDLGAAFSLYATLFGVG